MEDILDIYTTTRCKLNNKERKKRNARNMRYIIIRVTHLTLERIRDNHSQCVMPLPSTFPLFPPIPLPPQLAKSISYLPI